MKISIAGREQTVLIYTEADLTEGDVIVTLAKRATKDNSRVLYSARE